MRFNLKQSGSSLIEILALGLVADDFERTVIVAMVAMVMMEPTVDEIVDVVAVRDRLMPAAGSMDMARFVTFVASPRALGRIMGGYFNNMLLDIVPFLMVQMPIMQVVDMVPVLHRDVTTVRTVLMRMVSVRGMTGRHRAFSFRSIQA